MKNKDCPANSEGKVGEGRSGGASTTTTDEAVMLSPAPESGQPSEEELIEGLLLCGMCSAGPIRDRKEAEEIVSHNKNEIRKALGRYVSSRERAARIDEIKRMIDSANSKTLLSKRIKELEAMKP